MICTTLSPIPRFFWWRGIGCGTTKAPRRPAWMASRPTTWRPCGGVEDFLGELRTRLKDRSFQPVPVRERMIPKPGGKKRRLGIATVTDRVAQASLKLVLEPIFEADFLPCSYGFVRHEARGIEWRWETFTVVLSQQHDEAGGSLSRGTPGRVGAAPTTPGRSGTARRTGSGKQDQKAERE
jgi:hypothetical protein